MLSDMYFNILYCNFISIFNFPLLLVTEKTNELSFLFFCIQHAFTNGTLLCVEFFNINILLYF